MINIIKLIKEEYLSLNEEEYQGEHSAPGKEENAPLYDVTKNGIYPEDIYSSNAPRLYNSGLGDDMDRESLSIIQSLRKRPHNLIKIYRAIPDFNKDITKKLKSLYDIINYRNKFGFLPHTEFIHNLQDKYGNLTGDQYDVMNQNIVKEIQAQIENLKSQKESIRINNGDWVTINPRYAKQHGEDNLRNQYKVLTKTVRANQLYSDGNSIHEWGYNA